MFAGSHFLAAPEWTMFLVFKTMPISQNAFAALLFFGRFNSVLPPYLQEKNHEVFALLKSGKIRWFCDQLEA